MNKASEWATRCMHEAQMHERNCFITLTYDPENLPSGGSLNYRDFQLFLKRLRKMLGPATPIRYFMCGEYGGARDALGRPHYHAILFGIDFKFDRTFWKNSEKGFPMYNSPCLTEAWGLGYAVVDDLTRESAQYVARYCLKKTKASDRKKLIFRSEKGIPQFDTMCEHYIRIHPETGEVFKLVPEFVNMSRSNGIGHTWFVEYITDLYPKDFITVDGEELKVPQYYDRLLKRLDRPAYEDICAERRKRSALRPPPPTLSVLEVQEKLAKMRMQHDERTVS